MAIPKAVNTFVFIIRDNAEKELDGLILPDKSKTKPSTGEVFSIGGKVSDPDIKASKGKKAVFHKGIGQEIPIEGQEYLVLMEHEIIAIL